MWKIGIPKSRCFYHIQVIHNREERAVLYIGKSSYSLSTMPLNDMWTLGELDLGKAWPLYGNLMFPLLFWHGFDMVF